MTNLMIFSRRNTIEKWRYVSERLIFAKQVTIVGLLDDGCDTNIMADFYTYYHSKDTSEFALELIGAEECQEIIQRCRLLRNLSRQLALKMIGAMWLAFEKEIDRINPDLCLSTLIDFYAADILHRLLKQRNIPFLCLCGSILKNRMLVSTMGEYNFIAEPSPAEIDKALEEIIKPSFAPTVVASKKYNFSRFFKTKMIWQVRSAWLNILQLVHRDPLNPEYMTTPKIGDDYYVRWQDWQVNQYLDANWREKLTVVPFEKRVFVGLQYYPEATTDYWVRDPRLANCTIALTEIARVLTNQGFTVFVKDHPVMFGLRRTDMYESLSQIANVVFVPYEVKSQEMIELCKTIFTWTGTVGLQAVLAGKCAIITNTYYNTEEDFVSLNMWEDIASLPTRIDNFQIPDKLKLDEVRNRVLYKLCSSSISGQIKWLGLNIERSDIPVVNTFIDALNFYLPKLLVSHHNKSQLG